MNASVDARSRTPNSRPAAAAFRCGPSTPADVFWGTYVDCPHCGEPVAHPGFSRVGEPAMAECARCDVLFDVWDGTGRDS